MENSKIAWTHHTFNPVRGCEKVSPGCLHCYAEFESHRFPDIRGTWGSEAKGGTRIVPVPSSWREPLNWNRKAKAKGVRERVFTASLGDIFEDWKGIVHHPTKGGGKLPAVWDGKSIIRITEQIPGAGNRPATMNDAREQEFQLIEYTPWLDHLLLTKRPENIRRMIPDRWSVRLPDNVWIGTTMENQAMVEKRYPHLMNVKAKIRFVSCEPMLGKMDLAHFIDNHGDAEDDPEGWPTHYWPLSGEYSGRNEPIQTGRIDWVICGGESGANARPFHLEWAIELMEQCKAAGVPFFMKQIGSKPFYKGHRYPAAHRKGQNMAEWPEILRVQQVPNLKAA